MIVHELEVEVTDGRAGVISELDDHCGKLDVLHAFKAPLHSEWSCKVYVTLQYEALTPEAAHNNILTHEGGTSLSLFPDIP